MTGYSEITVHAGSPGPDLYFANPHSPIKQSTLDTISDHYGIEVKTYNGSLQDLYISFLSYNDVQASGERVALRLVVFVAYLSLLSTSIASTDSLNESGIPLDGCGSSLNGSGCLGVFFRRCNVIFVESMMYPFIHWCGIYDVTGDICGMCGEPGDICGIHDVPGDFC